MIPVKSCFINSRSSLSAGFLFAALMSLEFCAKFVYHGYFFRLSTGYLHFKTTRTLKRPKTVVPRWIWYSRDFLVTLPLAKHECLLYFSFPIKLSLQTTNGNSVCRTFVEVFLSFLSWHFFVQSNKEGTITEIAADLKDMKRI